MEVLYPRCAGIDVHKEVAVACAPSRRPTEVTQEVRSFATTTSALFELSAWLEEQQVHTRGDGSDRRVLEAGVACARG